MIDLFINGIYSLLLSIKKNIVWLIFKNPVNNIFKY